MEKIIQTVRGSKSPHCRCESSSYASFLARRFSKKSDWDFHAYSPSYTMFKKAKVGFSCSLDDHNNKNLYSTNNTFDISAAAVVAAVKNGLILATIWMMNFARTSFHIFSSRMARTDLLGGPLRALSILVKAFYRFEIVTG